MVDDVVSNKFYSFFKKITFWKIEASAIFDENMENTVKEEWEGLAIVALCKDIANNYSDPIHKPFSIDEEITVPGSYWK